jgi:hypothetical protein
MTAIEQTLMTIPEPSVGWPIEFNGRGWIGQTAFWARAVTAVSLLAGGMMLIPADWNSADIPPEAILACILAGPSLIYFTLSFFVGRRRGFICAALTVLVAIHLVAIAYAIVAYAGSALSDDWQWPCLVILGIGLSCGLANLAVAAHWARRWIRQPLFLSEGRRGFEILNAGPADAAQAPLISSDRGK